MAILDEDVADVIFDNSPNGRTLLYVRSLYSPRYAQAARAVLDTGSADVPKATRDLLATFDFDRIVPERSARLLHLTASLTRALDPLLGSLAPEEARKLVGAFCDSPFFWRGQGRSLAEHFCLFQHGVWTSDKRHAEADLARLYGVLSGLNEQPEKNSPWPGHTRESAAGIRAAETFSTVWPLVSAAGEPVLLPAIIGSAPRSIPVRMTISSTGYGEAFVSVRA